MQNSKTDLTKNTVSDSYLTATGKIRYTITNDYMFNVIFRHTDILAELLCSLLDLKREEITSGDQKSSSARQYHQGKGLCPGHPHPVKP